MNSQIPTVISAATGSIKVKAPATAPMLFPKAKLEPSAININDALLQGFTAHWSSLEVASPKLI
jgi:hypothetical protein